MPELPEVETVRRGLQPWIEGARIDAVTLNRANLRFPFPPGLSAALEGQSIISVGRRAKYLLIGLSNGTNVLSHLGMTGSWRFAEHGIDKPPCYSETAPVPKHDHMIWTISHARHGMAHLIYADPRRFGFIALYGAGETCAYLDGLGPEPLSNSFNGAALALALRGKKTAIKVALLDQRIVAGLGNIYVAEALHRAHILPTIAAGALVTATGRPKPALDALVLAIRDVLTEAIDAGGSTLRDFRKADGGSGYFQHHFAVYGREGAPCLAQSCTGTIQRIVQSGRATFFCPMCQKGP